MAKILFVDDDKSLAALVKDALVSAKYLVDVGYTGTEANFFLRTVPYDMAIFDWELPDQSGPHLVENLRMSGKALPVLMLTARAAIADKQEGYDAGADDYLTKPFEMQELLLKVKAILRRPKVIQPQRLKVRNIIVDLNTQEVFKNNEPITLLPKEYALLSFFAKHPKQIFNVNALLDRLWQTDADVGLETVRVTLMRVRQKLETPGEEPLISTIRGFGYRLDP